MANEIKYYSATKYIIHGCENPSWRRVADPVLLLCHGNDNHDGLDEFQIDEYNPLHLYQGCYRYTINEEVVYDSGTNYFTPENAVEGWYPTSEYAKDDENNADSSVWSTEDRNGHDTKKYNDGVCECATASVLKWSATKCSDCTFGPGYPTSWSGTATNPGPYKSSTDPLPSGMDEVSLTQVGTNQTNPQTIYVWCEAITVELCSADGVNCDGLQEVGFGAVDSDKVNYDVDFQAGHELNGFDPETCCPKRNECPGGQVTSICIEGYGDPDRDEPETCEVIGEPCVPPPTGEPPSSTNDPHVRTFFNKKYDM